MSEPLWCLLGPTAIGKSMLAHQLAKRLPIEIISVDSALIYRDMNIGTAKPTPAERLEVPYHLIDILDPSEQYSVGQFYRDCMQLVTEIKNRNHIPLLVGGTMLYFRSLWQGLADLPLADPNIRQNLALEEQKLGLAALYERLRQVDPISAKTIKSTDPQRILRALEVYAITGTPLSQLIQSTLLPAIPLRALALVPANRLALHQKIEARFNQMLQEGFVAEVQALKERGDLNANLPSMRTVGYRQIWQFLEKQISEREMHEQAIAATRQLAKRQLTWIRSMPMVTVIQDTEITQDQLQRFFQEDD